MNDAELDSLASVLRNSPADDTCRTQLGLLLYRIATKQRDQLRRIVLLLAKDADLTKLDDETQDIIMSLRESQ